ncbi:hypothetical protein MPDQ_006905 [Monascus purpureus]|uniref:Ribosomal protein/NADH dehydrogenase domain-containing protein n=1 Tax=Monascus purpureus TaxID=5098 RepID=A0A507QTJ5_MONPU|nr:hypothetical protein MPDQ_006905 [Monascus purpureus]
MVNLFKRLRKLRTILHVRIGQGAAILPSITSATKEHSAITRLHLTYAKKIYGGHQGARHFWRNCLPRLKYHNPGVQMTVKQTQDQDGPAALTVYFAGRATDTAMQHSSQIKDTHAPPPEANEKTIVLDLKDHDYKSIWNRLKAATGAQDVAATPEETAELQKWEKMRAQSEKDRARVAAIRQAKKDQEMMLKKARGEVEMLRQL